MLIGGALPPPHGQVRTQRLTCIQKRSYGIELSVFIIRIIAGVASTCGKYGVALNRSARWSGYTRNVWRPNVLVAAGKAANLVGERRHCQLSGPRAPFFAPLGLRAGVTHASTEARSFMGGPRRSSQGRCLLLPRGIVTLSRCGLPSLVHVPYLATHIDGHLARVGHQSARGAAVRSGSEGGRRPRPVSRHIALHTAESLTQKWVANAEVAQSDYERNAEQRRGALEPVPSAAFLERSYGSPTDIR